MSTDIHFQKIKNFLETNPGSLKLAELLPQDLEVKILAGDSLQMTYFIHKKKPFIEKRTTKSDLVSIQLTPEGVNLLTSSKAQEFSDLITDMAKIYLAGDLKIKTQLDLGSLQTQLLQAALKIPSLIDSTGIPELIRKKFSGK